jgi:hypothetical protein
MLRVGELQYIYLLSDILKKPNPEVEKAGITFIHNYLQANINNGQFAEINDFLEQVDIDKTHKTFLLVIFLSLYRVADKVPGFNTFVEKVKTLTLLH